MPQSLNSAGAVGYDITLVLAIELSSKSWVLAAQVPGRRPLTERHPAERLAPEKPSSIG